MIKTLHHLRFDVVNSVAIKIGIQRILPNEIDFIGQNCYRLAILQSIINSIVNNLLKLISIGILYRVVGEMGSFLFIIATSILVFITVGCFAIILKSLKNINLLNIVDSEFLCFRTMHFVKPCQRSLRGLKIFSQPQPLLMMFALEISILP